MAVALAVVVTVVVTVVVGFIGFVLLFKHDKRFSGLPYAGLYSFYPAFTQFLPFYPVFGILLRFSF